MKLICIEIQSITFRGVQKKTNITKFNIR